MVYHRVVVTDEREAPSDEALVRERLAELGERQDAITAHRRLDLVGREVEVLVDTPGTGRTHREAPEIDGVVTVPVALAPGTFHTVTVADALGPDLLADAPVLSPVAPGAAS